MHGITFRNGRIILTIMQTGQVNVIKCYKCKVKILFTVEKSSDLLLAIVRQLLLAPEQDRAIRFS
jgi:hypothetical protein